MFTPPQDIDDRALASFVSAAWGVDITGIVYMPVGFGSHHWDASGRGGRWFVTLDDLQIRLVADDDSLDAAFARLDRAFRSAVLLAESGLGFVVAPMVSRDGAVTRRLSEKYSVVVHRHLDGTVPPHDSECAYLEHRDREAVLGLLTELHASTEVVDGVALRDDLRVPLRSGLEDAIARRGEPWDTGPYGSSARELLDQHGADVLCLLTALDDLAARVLADRQRQVVTHGEPGALNVMIAGGGHYLVDWESARIAPPERDLWTLAGEDPAVVDLYARRTSTVIDTAALDAYRLWFDLCEIAGYIDLFRRPHLSSADCAESWKNLQIFLRPQERWPHLL